MTKAAVYCILFILNTIFTQSSYVFHENTNIIFQPQYSAEYFGFSTLLTTDGILVGAPKAHHPDLMKSINPGVVFYCSLHELTEKHVNCTPLRRDSIFRPSDVRDIYRLMPPDFLKDDVWFGATMVQLPNERLLINAPRWTSPYGRKHLLMNGASFLHTTRGYRVIYPLREISRQAYMTDGERREYGEYGTHLNYYAYGQAGMSAAVTKANTVILGAPGLLQWTGGIVSLSFDPNDSNANLNRLPTANTYNTKDLGPDDYFGYSVGSGIFDRTGNTLYVAGAPRNNIASGQVLIFKPPTQELDSLKIMAKVKGTQSGSYFGASVCCTDINGDGFDDLLVGAPTFVNTEDWLPYDQGAVYVFLTTVKESGFILEEAGYVTGSGTNGAWFGNAITDLGDIDGDGFQDVAIGAPWENDGIGAVYIYRGNLEGLSNKNVQRIQPAGGRGFGWSLSKGVDVDHNNCNDLAIGAHNSQTTYLYRCVPTMQVDAIIRVPDAINLPQNTTNFTAVFCASAPVTHLWPNVEINMIGKIEADPESNRAMISGDSEIAFHLMPGREICHEQTIEINPLADLSKPISLVFTLEPDELMKENSTIFLSNAARLSDNSTLKTSFLIQLVKDCGEDLICTPWLIMTLKAFHSPHVPGSNTTLGLRVTVTNKAEPAYGAEVLISQSLPLKRIPSECTYKKYNLTCKINNLLRDEDIFWDLELDDTNEKYQVDASYFHVRAELTDPLLRNVTDEAKKELVLEVIPMSNFSVSGKPMPNVTILVSRESLEAGANISFKHYFEITNLGPSDAPVLAADIIPRNRTRISANISGCERDVDKDYPDIELQKCVWKIPAKVSYPVYVPLQLDLSVEGDFLRENNTYNATTLIIVHRKSYGYPNYIYYEVTTTFILEPESYTWKLILICVLLGLLLLGVIVYILYKRGFFQRTTRKMLQLQKDKDQQLIQESESSSSHYETEGETQREEESDDVDYHEL
ncbi:unnamed protein product [Chrysodeixis includens]|uniref:Integrin alpha second immunoglobulin-like domain-containing protein n=1 Tax=Chrysodeixis includens TaxID=689277 RepID=A0A9P0FSE4_CHRIL|nr:unnamed protein product [Chrysodeixis includens]